MAAAGIGAERGADEIEGTGMTREQRIVEVFVELADSLVGDFDVIDLLHRLTERCVEFLDCAEAGLLLADAAGALRVMASSSERTEALELLQSQPRDGPCVECYQHGVPVSSDDLAADAARWPAFAPAAIEQRGSTRCRRSRCACAATPSGR